MFYRNENEASTTKISHDVNFEFIDKLEGDGIQSLIVAIKRSFGSVVEQVILSCRVENKLMMSSYRNAALAFEPTHLLGACDLFQVYMVDDQARNFIFPNWSNYFCDEENPNITLGDVFQEQYKSSAYTIPVITTQEEINKWVKNCPVVEGQSIGVRKESFEVHEYKNLHLVNPSAPDDCVWTVERIDASSLTAPSSYTYIDCCFDAPSKSKRSRKETNSVTVPDSISREQSGLNFYGSNYIVFQHEGMWVVAFSDQPLQNDGGDELFVMVTVAHCFGCRFDWELSKRYSQVVFSGFESSQAACEFVEQFDFLLLSA